MLVTVVGSYPKIPNRPRPARLRNAYARLDSGDISAAAVAEVERLVTVEMLAEQAQAGVELLTDGQVRWADEVTYIAARLDNVSLGGLVRFFDTNTYYREPQVRGPLRWQAPVTLADYEFARVRTDRPLKPVLTGPYTLARHSRDEHYGSFQALVTAYAEALNQEARALQAVGPPLIQFNEPSVCRHPEDAALALRAWRTLLDGIEVETAVYFYHGLPGAALASAVEAGFTTAGLDLTLEGAIDALADGPRPAKLAAGVIDARTTLMEPRDAVAARVEAAARLAGEDLYLNPNMGLEYLPREQAQAKLALLARTVADLRGGTQ